MKHRVELQALGRLPFQPDFAVRPHCGHEGCPKAPLWMPVIKVWARGHLKSGHPPCVAKAGVGYCDEHKSEFTLELCDPIFAAINEACKHAGKAEIDVTSAELEFEPVLMTEDKDE